MVVVVVGGGGGGGVDVPLPDLFVNARWSWFAFGGLIYDLIKGTGLCDSMVSLALPKPTATSLKFSQHYHLSGPNVASINELTIDSRYCLVTVHYWSPGEGRGWDEGGVGGGGVVGQKKVGMTSHNFYKLWEMQANIRVNKA